METENYYQNNLDTGKLNVHTTKSFYEALSKEQKDVFKKFCLWSRSQNCWVSKGKWENCYLLKRGLDELGFSRNAAVGEKPSFEEQVNREKDRAEYRQEMAEKRADNAEKRSDALYDSAKKMAEVIPFGQPILIGHHSEKRDRNYRNKISGKFEKAFQESDKADYYKEKANTAKYTAEGRKFSNPRYLSNRIKESEKHIRVCQRRLSGKYNPGSPVEPISDKAREFYDKRIAEETEKLEYYYKCMKVIDPEWLPGAKVPKKTKGNRM